MINAILIDIYYLYWRTCTDTMAITHTFYSAPNLGSLPFNDNIHRTFFDIDNNGNHSGIELQVEAAAQPAKDGVPSETRQVVADQQNVNDVNHMDVVSKAMMTNGGYCWKVALIALWSFVLVEALPQFILGCILVAIYSDDDHTSYYWGDDECCAPVD